jgi:methyl-accepting chemotaxis protein
MKVSTKLNYAFIIISLIILFSTIVTFISLTTIEDNTEEALESRLHQITLATNINFNLAMEDIYTRSLVLDPSDMTNKAFIEEFANLIEQDIIAYQAISSEPEMTTYIDNLIALRLTYKEVEETLFTILEANDYEKATALILKDLGDLNDQIVTQTSAILAFQNEQMDIIKSKTANSVISAKTISIIALTGMLLITVIVIFFVNKTITKPLNRVMNSAKQIAEGNLTEQDLKMTAKDEIGQLGNIFDEMKNTLNQLIQSIQSNAEHLSTAAEELVASTEEINASSEEVSVQLGRSAASAERSMNASEHSTLSMQDTANGVERIVVSAQELQSTSKDTEIASHQGNELLEQAKQQMVTIQGSTIAVNEVVQKLSKQTEEIQHITKVIADITDQTNLLALNASIEAARAGEHGKGFAVVANEVKNLAEQSKTSANSIEQLIQEIQGDTQNVLQAVTRSIQSVEDGVNIITETGESFNQILKSVDKIAVQIEEVSSTAEQLSANASIVTNAMDEIAQDSKHSSQELNTVSQAMEEQVLTIQEVSQVAITLTENATNLQSETLRFKV